MPDLLDDDQRFMQAALALGRHAMGLAAPNPAVSALVVKNGIVLGRGVTAPGGRPHAEPIALAEAGPEARGATLYVTLEPCSHHGRTPPCVEAVLDAGIARVVIALEDPDPRVAGRGIARLRAEGVEVVESVAHDLAARDHRGHCLRVTAGRPTVTLKMAETADGFAAGAPGTERLLITGSVANGRVQILRATHDAILVGIGTALEDDPRLTVRLPGVDHHRPLRIALDRHLRLPLRSALVRTARSIPLLVFAGNDAPDDRAAELEGQGVELRRVAAAPEGGLDLQAVLRDLGGRGATRVLCEGGPRLGSALLEAGLVDSVALFTSPRVLGAPGRQSFSTAARSRFENSDHYLLHDDARIGPDRLRVFERRVVACSQG